MRRRHRRVRSADLTMHATTTCRPFALLILVVLMVAGRGAGAFDFFDGRIQIHGYGETTLRGIADDFHPENAVATQWMNVLNLEVEAAIAPDGFGPFDLISGFSRVLVRYDCIYNGCGVVPTWRYYGDRANRQARNLTDGRTNPYNGVLRESDPLPDAFGNVDRMDFPERDVHQGNELLSTIQLPFFSELARLGSDGLAPTIYPIRDARFAVKDIDASLGNGNFVLGPWRPDADIDPIGSLDVSSNTTLPLPLRPMVPPAGTQGGLSPRGLFIPSNSLIEHEDDFDDFDQNYTQNELAWHHVGSQDERELKEAYVDAEMFDGRLWLRAGKQSIVWGKTELFRTTDQFNPQTLALSSLPSLEESRIALWSVRGTWSFYDVGPLEDVRLEVAANLDDFEPLDLGRCGVPYTVWLVCGKTFGLWGHGFAGAGIAGENRPDDWWNDVKGLEVGARMEFRWDRFSFQISDFWGYEDLFTIDNFNEYERKVDPYTGRPLDVNGNPLLPGTPAADVLRLHPANRQLFDVSCAATVGIAKNVFPDLADRCLVDLVNSEETIVLGFVSPANALSAVLAGSSSGDVVMATLAPGAPPLEQLNRDPADGLSNSPFGPRQGLGAFLTDQQEALLGCGPFYGTDCDVNGIDLFNAEASVLIQSFPQFEPGGPVATRYVPGAGSVILPGAHGPTDAGYSAYVDGCSGPGPVGCNAGDPGRVGPSASLLTNPLTGAVFRNELAAASYNFMVLLAGLSAGTGTDPACVPSDPFSCALVRGVFGIAGVRRPEVRAGGNGQFGRRDFIWSGGSEIQLRYLKRNVLGFATDFAHDASGTNWSVEATWINGQPFGVTSEESGWDRFDTYNLTLSVDRPTFIKFLNQSRTFFINSQLFLRYIDDYKDNDQMGVHGPVSALGTLSFITGYHQDRLLPAVTWVHDVASSSGALITQISYRFSQDFSATFGIAGYYGDPDELQVPLRQPLLGNQGGDYKADVRYDGLSAISERDEAFLTLRYTF